MKRLLSSKNKFSTISTTEESNIGKKKRLETLYAEEKFLELLKDKIKTEISWEEAERKFSDDLIWKNENLVNEKKVNIFKDFIFNMRETKKKAFVKLLADKIGLNPEINWHEAQKILQSEQKFKDVQERDRDILFQEHMAFVQERILSDFVYFLENNPLVTKDTPIEGPLFKEIINKLSSDTRTQRIAKWPDKRDKAIRAKIKSLKFAFDKEMRRGKKNE